MKANLENSPKVDDLEVKDVPSIFKLQKEYFETNDTWDYNFRVDALKTLRKMLQENEDLIVDALKKDMGRPYFEAYGAEIGNLYVEIKHVLKNLKKWMKPHKVSTGLANFKSSAKIEHIPRGVTLIVTAWNYPILLSLLPLISSIAAGNTAIIKPSEYATHSAKLLDDLMAEYFDLGYIDVIPGGIETAQELMKQGFDQILFTGSEEVGRIYAEAAAKTLTPIILEMGGKSPTIIDKTAKLEIAVERAIFAKFINASQTCVAPDYILVHEDVKEEFISIAKAKIQEFYGENPQESEDFSRIINEGHFERIERLLDTTTGDVILGGSTDRNDLYIEPTFIDNPSKHDAIMQEEIFGPLLPIISYSDYSEIREYVDLNPNPLALYVFSENREFIKKIRQNIACGDFVINDAALHFSIPGLKIGGIRSSGLGGYRGKTGFEAFSHKQSVFEKSTWFQLPFVKPPYTNFKEKLLNFFLS